jgi:hypothetical protein
MCESLLASRPEPLLNTVLQRPSLPLRDPSLGGRQLTSHSALRDSKCRVCCSKKTMLAFCLFPPLPSPSASLRQCRCLLVVVRHAIGASSPLRVPSAGDHGALLRRCSHDHDCPLLMRSLALIPLFLLSHLRLCLWQSTDGLTGFSSVIRSGVVLPPCPPPLSETSQRSPCVHLSFVCLHNRLTKCR